MTLQAAGIKRVASALTGAALIADTLFLLRDGQLNLGVTLPFCVGVALLFFAIQWHQVHRRLDNSRNLRRLWHAAWIAAFAWLCSLGVFFAYLSRTGTNAPPEAPHAILVLGSGAPGGKVSPTLVARLDAALAQAARYPDVPVVVSGGIGYGERSSEGRVMGDYLRAHGLAASRIVQEERADSTQENMVFSLPLLRERGVLPNDLVQIVTSDFHTLRALKIARRAGYERVSAVGSATPLYLRYNAWLREYFAYASGLLLGEYSLAGVVAGLSPIAASFPTLSLHSSAPAH